MSQENVELIKKIAPPPGTDWAGAFRDDAVWAAVKKAVAPFLTPDFQGAFMVWDQIETEFTGIDGMRQAFLEWLAPWASYYSDDQDHIAAGDDQVIVLGRQHGRRTDTGAEVLADTAGVYLVRNGKIARADYYTSQTEALAAVGLSERGAHADD